MALLENLTFLDASSSSGFLLLGFLIGMVHALEADHLAAVSTLSNGGKNKLLLRGAVWGLGHTVTLLVVSIGVIVFSLVISQRSAAALEFAVGVMLVFLGVQVVHRFRKERLHYHVHQHEGQKRHMHVHSHAGDKVDHAQSIHDHEHAERFALKAFVVGLLHGAAGSSGLIVLAVSTTGDPWLAVSYVGLVGLGSALGMAALSVVVGWPVLQAPKIAKGLHTGVQMTIAAVVVAIGLSIMWETGPVAWGVG
tara:strand:- start:1210 stop:1962 length:753 start_codon:yes stop_codon:yes gene_type:complete